MSHHHLPVLLITSFRFYSLHPRPVPTASSTLLDHNTAAHNFGSETKKATGMPMYMSIGQCGSVLGSHIFPATEGPQYTRGFAITCGFEFLAALCGLILSVSCATSSPAVGTTDLEELGLKVEFNLKSFCCVHRFPIDWRIDRGIGYMGNRT